MLFGGEGVFVELNGPLLVPLVNREYISLFVKFRFSGGGVGLSLPLEIPRSANASLYHDAEVKPSVDDFFRSCGVVNVAVSDSHRHLEISAALTWQQQRFTYS